MTDMADVLKVNQQFLNGNQQTENLSITQEKPKFPQYAVVSKRLESYKTWPDDLPLKPEALVEAGLVYTGVGDSVRCFYCGGGLRNWWREDNPWEEHAKWYPTCPHVLLVKGEGYVERVKKGEKPDMDVPKSALMEPPTAGLDLMDTAAARACIDMGYQEDMVRKAIDVYFNTSGGKFDFKGADLCEILFNLEEEEEESKKKELVMSQNVAVSATTNEAEAEVEDEEPNSSDQKQRKALEQELETLKNAKLETEKLEKQKTSLEIEKLKCEINQLKMKEHTCYSIKEVYGGNFNMYCHQH